MNILELKNICKSYGNSNIIKNLNLKISKGEMVAIMGPSGSGKSTLLNIIGCLDAPTNGSYIINGENIDKLSNKKLSNIRNKTFGFVVQYFALIDEYTIFDNVKIPLTYSTKKVINKKEKIISLLDKLGIGDKKKSYPNQLSGGQNQRAAIARALVNDPEIILADEPTGALDKKTGYEVMGLFETLNKEGKTIIIVTHDEKVAKCCNRIILIEDGQIVLNKEDSQNEK